MIKRIEYVPFGNKRIELGTYNNIKNRFTGQYEDEESDLYYYQQRYYDPVLSRFITADPLYAEEMDERGTNSQELNLYAYVKNNPVNYTDPTGNASFSENFASRQESMSQISGVIKTATGLAIASAYNAAAKSELGMGVGIKELVQTRGNIPGLGTAAGSIGAFALNAATKTVLVGGSFYSGVMGGSLVGAGVDTLVDNSKGNVNGFFSNLLRDSGFGNFLSSLGFGSGTANNELQTDPATNADVNSLDNGSNVTTPSDISNPN